MATSKIRRSGRRGGGLAVLPLLVACATTRDQGAAQDEPTQVEVPCDESGQGDGLCAPLGGQSGTEGGSETACDESQTRAPAVDEVLEPLGRSLGDLAATIGAPVTPGRWLATAERSELSFELGPLASALEISSYGNGWLCDWQLDVQSVTVRSSDGAIDAQLPARIRRPDPNYPTVIFDVELAGLPEAYLQPVIPSFDVPSVRAHAGDLPAPRTSAPALVVAVRLEEATTPFVRAVAYDGDEVIGIWSGDERSVPAGLPLAYTPSEPLASECGGAATVPQLAFTSFPSAAAALEGITGTWARCLDIAEAEHAGLRILPDGSWQHVALESGQLVARSGFGREGFVRLIDTSSMNSDGQFQLELWPAARMNGYASRLNDRSTWASEQALVFLSPQEGWPAAVYLPSALTPSAELPAFADGERAGEAACARGEMGIVASAEESAEALTGEYVRCSGSLPGDIAKIRFGTSSLELLTDDGSLLAAPSYSLDSTYAPGGVHVLVGEGEGYRHWSVAVSRYPRKLWVRQSREYGFDDAVFSAMP